MSQTMLRQYHKAQESAVRSATSKRNPAEQVYEEGTQFLARGPDLESMLEGLKRLKAETEDLIASKDVRLDGLQPDVQKQLKDSKDYLKGRRPLALRDGMIAGDLSVKERSVSDATRAKARAAGAVGNMKNNAEMWDIMRGKKVLRKDAERKPVEKAREMSLEASFDDWKSQLGKN